MALQSQPADKFMGVQIDRNDTAFDAAQYSFFGDLKEEALEGALEDGLDAPPVEEGLLGGLEDDEIDPALLKDDEQEDITLLGMLGNDLDDDSALEAAMQRSLPPQMFADEDERQGQRNVEQLQHPQPRMGGPGAAAITLTPPRGFQEAQPYQHSTPQQQQHQDGAQGLKPKRPMTLAEVEAQMQADTMAKQSQQQIPQHHQQPPGFHSPYPQHPHPHPHHGPMPPQHHPPGMGHMGPPPYPPPQFPPQYPYGPHGNMHMLPPHMQQMHAPRPGPYMNANHMNMPPPPGMMGMGMEQQQAAMRPPHMLPHPPPGMHHPVAHQQGPRAPLTVPPGMGLAPPSTPPHTLPAPGLRSASPNHAPQTAPPGMRAPLLAHHVQANSMTPPPHRGPSSVASFDTRSMFGGSTFSTPIGGFGGLSAGPRYSGKWMSTGEVENIVRLMYAAVHAGVPYIEDYAYQAFVHQYTNGRNSLTFRPEVLRSLQPDMIRIDPSALVRFANVDGLGKIVLSNIRTPKVLMELTNAPTTAGIAASGPGSEVTHTRPLEQEPLLAARIMVEDCHDKLLDVDDIDRCLTAASISPGIGLPDKPHALLQRRALLAAAITHALRVPAQPTGGSRNPTEGDDVFLNIMSLPKGRGMLARSIKVLIAKAPGPESQMLAINGDADQSSIPNLTNPEHLLWALLRNAHHVFGASISDPDMKIANLGPLVEATHRLAAAAKDAIHHLSTPQQLLDAMLAIEAGISTHLPSDESVPTSPIDAVLPLAQVRKLPNPISDSTPSEWLADVAIALLQRGTHLISEKETDPAGLQLASRWQQGRNCIVQAFLRHVNALSTLQQEVSKMAAAKGGQPPPETVVALRNLACRPLAQQLMGYVTDAAAAERLKQQLRQLL